LPDNRSLWIVTANQDNTKVFEKREHIQSGVVQLYADDVYAEISFNHVSKQKIEFYFGSGYLSQSTRKMRIPKGATEVTVYNVKGLSRKVSTKRIVQ
jgi:hypothetical protein